MDSARQQSRLHDATTATLESTGRGVSVEWQLAPGDAVAARTIRHVITGCLRQAAGEGADLDAAELVVGELLSNVVMHTSSPATVGLTWRSGHPVLSVREPGPVQPPVSPSAGLPAHRLPDDPMATGGRGLFLVSRLSRGLTVDSTEHGGTTIRVTLDRPRPA